MKIAVKRVYEMPSAADGFRVLVDRVWPRGMSKEHARIDLWAKNVAPSTELRKWFGHDPAKWDAFREKYRAELAADTEELATLRDAVKGGKKVTLVYGAKDEEHNQALVLRDVLQSGALEHFNFEIIHSGKMLRPCQTKCGKAREFGVGGLCPPLNDKLKAKRL